MQARFFLSYSRQDQELVSRALKVLNEPGGPFPLGALEMTLPLELETANQIRTELRDKIESSSLVLLFWSKKAAVSQWVRYELGMARAYGKEVIVVVIDGYAPEMPVDLAESKILNLEDLRFRGRAATIKEKTEVAEPNYLEILRQGVAAWNAWREENPFLRPDLSNASLEGANLSGANLSDTRLISANLAGADLLVANLHAADLTHANLSDANLFGTNLSEANCEEANFTRAWFYGTVLGNTNLTYVTGLDTCRHFSPSTIDHRTLARSGTLPIAFLRGCGLPDFIIDNIEVIRGDPIHFFSCFISYSSKNDAFARRLHADLQDTGVRCWFAPEDMKVGSKIRSTIDSAIRLRDKLLLILSEHSIESQWVKDEVKAVYEEEARRGKTILFPIRLDDAVMDTAEAWAAKLRRQRHIGDFTHWKDHDQYNESFQRLLRDLKA